MADDFQSSSGMTPDELLNLIDSPESGDLGSEQQLTPDDFLSLLDEKFTNSPVLANLLAGQAAMTYGKEASPEEISLLVQSNPEYQLAAKAQDVLNRIDAQNREFINEQIKSTTPRDPNAILDQTIQQNERLNKMRQSPVVEERALVESVANKSMSDAVREELAWEIGVRNELAKMLASQDTGDRWADIAASFIPFKKSLDILDVKDEISADPVLGQYIKAEDLPGMVGKWQSLPLEKKQALYPALKNAVLNAAGTGWTGTENITKATELLLDFFAPEGGEELKDKLWIDIGLGISTLPTSVVVGAPRLAAGVTAGTAKAAVGLLSKAANLAHRENNLVKIASKAGNPDRAAAITINAAVDETVAKAAGIDKVTAYGNMMPGPVVREWFPEITNDSSMISSVAKILERFARTAEGKVRSVTTEADLLRHGALDEPSRRLVVRSFMRDMERKGEDLLNDGIQLRNLNIVSEDARGFVFEYELANTTKAQAKVVPAKTKKGPGRARAQRIVSQETESVEKVQGTMLWRINKETGNFEATAAALEATGGKTYGLSPGTWSVNGVDGGLDFNYAVKQAIALDDVTIAAQVSINELWREANKEIIGFTKANSRRRVDAVELAGDEFVNPDTAIKGKVFTPQELAGGIETNRGTIYLTDPKEVAAYYKRRIVADSLHNINDFAAKRELELGGFKGLRAFGKELFARPYESTAAAKAAVRDRTGFNVWKQTENETVSLTDEAIDAAYAEGNVLVRLKDDFNVAAAGNPLANGERVEYMFVKPGRLRDDLGQVIHYRRGYVPKINEGVEFVVRQKIPYFKAGQSGAGRHVALRAFASRREANQFLNEMIEKEIADSAGKLTREQAEKLFEIADGSVMAQMERMEDALSGSGGLFKGPRSEDGLYLGLAAVDIQRMAPTEAFGRYIARVGTLVSKNEWRIGLEKKWMNTVREVLPEVKIEGFNGTKLTADAKGKSLEQLRRQINIWNRVPSKDERMFEGLVQSFHDWALATDKKYLGIHEANIPSILWLKHANPIQALKSGAMHMTLGVFKLDQLFVQSASAYVAASTLGIRDIPRMLNTSMTFHILDNIREAGALGRAYKALLGERVIDREMVEAYKAWRRTGMRDSISSNADIAYTSGYGVGLTTNILRTVDHASLSIYRAGELINRRISFATAFQQWRARFPTRELTDDALQEVVEQANLYMLELKTANRAWWQGGPDKVWYQQMSGLMTQFLQVPVKTMELVAKGQRRGGFTAQQKRRIILGNLALFGAAGVPLMNTVAGPVAEWLGIPMNGDTAAAINQGLSGALIYSLFGADVDVAGRVALGSAVTDTLRDVLTSQEPIWVKAFGVSGDIIKRFRDAYRQIHPLAGGMLSAEDDPLQVSSSQFLTGLMELEPLMMADRSYTKPTTTAQAINAMRIIFSTIPSQGRALQKAWLMHKYGLIRDNHGSPVTVEDFNMLEELAVAAGFQPNVEARIRMTKMNNDTIDQLVQDQADTIINLYHEWVFVHDRDPGWGDMMKDAVQFIHESMDNPLLVSKIIESLDRRLYKEPTTKKERELNRFLNNTAPDRLSEGAMIDIQRSPTLGQTLFSPFREQAVTLPAQDLGE